MHSRALFVTNSCANRMMSKDGFELEKEASYDIGDSLPEQDCYSRRIWLGFKCG